MSVHMIDAALLKKMFLAGVKNLEAKKEWINELNVFPVPDGDTGTNMTLTILSAAREVTALGDNPSMEDLAKAISSGSLRGARGNSGVILSQLFRGFTKEIKYVEKIDTMILANALKRAAETAYKAVMKPKEGTILTVAKGMADKAQELSEKEEDLERFIRKVIEHGDFVLSQTPEMLPVLKQAGVVDSGGQGLMQILRGALDGFLGKEIPVDDIVQPKKTEEPVAMDRSQIETANIKFGYCTEFIIMTEQPFTEYDEMAFKSFLESIGDSIVCVADEDVVKVHVHTNHPGQAIERALTYGALSKMKIDNMREEHQERLIKDAEKIAQQQKEQEAKKERKPVGFIAVSVGDGLAEIFKGLGVDYLIEGGQTMNPSTEDVLNAVDKVNADVVYIFPNNKNIILAAEQAKSLVKEKELIVIPSKTIPQGITAMIHFVSEKSAQENTAAMMEEMQHVKTGQITYAVRDTTIDGVEIHKDDIMAVGDNGILAAGTELNQTAFEAAKAMIDEESELVSIYYGADITEEEAQNLADQIVKQNPLIEVEVNEGGQPVYYYIMSVE
ncbi:MAG TPA: DAK2 domain-containing protein [Candidatus Fimimorpha faecalis]|uniref:DAK2 domain-containing protein n=1 Tax=Candidatus Fimimorpha faecalis TaxID=2840824 RepID=A0A9D1JBV2_9FIRM|nr:DAK2 domain-containing protein [Candidatus Fimimorpha faecalis]